MNTTTYSFIYTSYNTREISHVTFTLKGGRDAYVGLLADVKSQFTGEPFYEIVIGGWNNLGVALRKIGNNGTEVKYPPANNNGYLNAQEFRHFWISWKDHVISLGFGTKVGQGTLFSHDDKASPMDINHLAFSSFSPLQWKYYDGR